MISPLNFATSFSFSFKFFFVLRRSLLYSFCDRCVYPVPEMPLLRSPDLSRVTAGAPVLAGPSRSPVGCEAEVLDGYTSISCVDGLVMTLSGSALVLSSEVVGTVLLFALSTCLGATAYCAAAS